jgi:hypothetical protein
MLSSLKGRLFRSSRERELVAVLREGVEAVRLTREYLGSEAIPDVPGWSLADFSRHATSMIGPEDANRLARQSRNAATIP